MKKLAIVGATGIVGQSVLDVLKEEGLSKRFEIFMLGSVRSSGKDLIYDGKRYFIKEINEEILKIGFDYSIFVTTEEVSCDWVEKFSNYGVVIDNSSVFRMKENIPLIVPEINFKDIRSEDKIIANPNCSTIQLVLVLDKLRKVADIDTVVVSSYQSVSGAGRDALQDLEKGTRNVFECGIKDNFIARIGAIDQNLNCSEENKIINETQKILNQDIKIFATTVRVPIHFCHGESVYVKFKKKVNLDLIKKCLECDYIELTEDLFYPKDCARTNLTYVCRLRQQSDTEVLFFVIADNLRRGASFNAIEILKKLENI